MATKSPLVYFFFLTGAKKGKIESSDAQIVRIGRQPFCEIQLDPQQDLPASGEHCHVLREDRIYFLLDSGSSFGTFLNGERVEGRVPLNTGDVIECGKDAESQREGPRIKFYLETDVRKCPICEMPVYKRHFKCPECGQKTCLRCIDFKRKVCKRCGEQARAEKEGSGSRSRRKAKKTSSHSAHDEAESEKPAKAASKGKDAEKLKKKRAKATSEERKARKKTAVIPNVAAEERSCGICRTVVRVPVFLCPACQGTFCERHRRGRVCPPCAGLPIDEPAPSARPSTGGSTSLDLAIPKIAAPGNADRATAAPGRSAPPMPAPARASSLAVPPSVPRVAAAPPPTVGSNRPSGASRPDEAVPGTQRFRPAPRPGSLAPAMPPHGMRPGPEITGSRGQVPSPASPASGIATCARCRGHLGQGTFACRSCKRVLCPAHLAIDEVCDDCYLRGALPHPERRPSPSPAPRVPAPAPAPRAGVSRTALAPKAARPEPPRSGPRPPGWHTRELPASEVSDPFLPPTFDPMHAPTLAEIEALEMMPLLDTEREARADESNDLAKPPPGSSRGKFRFECPYCDLVLDARARSCPRCKKAL